jgi:hypothetical protein
MIFGGSTSNAKTPAAAKGIRFQTSCQGVGCPLAYGTNSCSMNILWYGDFKAIAHEQQGGKGMGGSTGGKSYTYECAFIGALCRGPIDAVSKVYENKKSGTLSKFGLTWKAGTYSQDAWTHLTTSHPTEALTYRGIAYVAAGSYDLGSSPNLPNLTFEIQAMQRMDGTNDDCDPADVIEDFILNTKHGACPGFPLADLHSGDNCLSNYCRAAGLLISPLFSEQKEAASHLEPILDACNSVPIWSDATLKIIPRGDSSMTGHGATYTPISAPLFDLDYDDFKPAEGEPPVTIERKRPADVPNSYQAECLNRGHKYAPAIITNRNLAYIKQYGLNPDETQQWHFFALPSIAKHAIQLRQQRMTSILNTYRFRLGIDSTSMRLEPMDPVTLTDPLLGLDREPVKILSIKESGDKYFEIVAEEWPAGAHTRAVYPDQEDSGYEEDYNVDPGSVNAPLIFEPPGEMVGPSPELWMAVSGGNDNWGGCEIWVSTDGSSYAYLDSIEHPARHGVLSAYFADGSHIDTTHTLSVDLTECRGTLTAGSKKDARLLNTLCCILDADRGYELLAYSDADLTDDYQYDLGTYIVRGAYGTEITEHHTNSKFARLNRGIFKYQYPIDRVGRPLRFKFVSKNIYGFGLQDISSLDCYTVYPQGLAIGSVLANLTDLWTQITGGVLELIWPAVSDYRPVDYEIRLGSSWSTAIMQGRTPNTHFRISADGTYWVAAHYLSPTGEHIYSGAPSSLAVVGSRPITNVVVSYSEEPTWTGTKTNVEVQG